MNLTISGHEKNIDKLAEMLEAEKIFCKRPNVLNAYHSSYMKPVADDYRELIGTISAPSGVADNGNYGRVITMFSSVTGEEVQARLLQDAQYWVDNLLCPVRFSQSLLAMCSPASSKKPKLRVGRSTDTPLQHLVEIGPHPALQSAVPQILGQNMALSGIECHHLLRRRISGVETTLSTLAKLFSCGYPVDLVAVNHKSHQFEGGNFVQPQMLVDLPPYPFNHSQTYWPESRLSKNFRFRRHPRHDLLGATVPDWNVNDPKWRQIFRVSENPWLKHHKVTGRMVYPGVGYIIMAIEAARQLCEDQEANVTGFCLRDIAIRSALQIPETEDGVEVMLSMPPATESSLLDSATWKQFKISSYNPGTREWTEHCRGMITVEMKSHPNPLSHTQADDKTETRQDKRAKLVEKCTVPFDMTRAYAELETIGLSFGPLFKNLSQVKRGGGLGEAVGQIIIPDVAATQPKNFTHPHIIHPATMDSMLHLVLAAIQDKTGQSRPSEPMVPVFIGEVWVAQNLSSRPGTIFHGHGTVQNVAHKKLRGSISIWDEESESKVRFGGIQFVQLQSSSAASQRRQLSFNIAWKPDVELFDPRECEKYLLATVKPIKLQIETVYRLAEAFNLASILYITEALRELQDIVVDDLPQHLQRYLAWMKHQDGMFRQDKILHQRAGWRMVLNSQTLREKLLAEVEKTGPEGRLTNRMGGSIVPILRQEADALQLMFGDGLLDQYYRELHGTENIHQLIRSYIDLYSFKYGNLKILEIGAGTGGTTLPVLETLNPSDGNPRAVQYTYTDVSPGFFENAKAKFRPYLHIVEFRRLDIEKDPLTQGFNEGHYDMIIAANVLHATADISNTLTNARKLLRTGGVLLLQEAVNPALLSGPLAFGTLPGWWLGQEESRKLSPILDESQWGDALKESGFRGADLVLKDHSDQKIHGQSLIVATAHESSSLQQRSLASSPESVIIISSPSSSKLGVEVEKSLRSAGVSDVRILADDAALAGTDFKKCVCIVLRELETSILKDISGEDFENMRKLLTTCKDLVWVTGNTITNPDLGLSTGLIRSIRWERDLDGSNLVTIAFDSVDSPPASMASQIARIFDYEFCRPSKQQHAEYRVDNQTISINRLTNAPYLDEYLSAKLNARVAQPQAIGSNPQRALKLGTDCPGLLNKLQFVDCPVYPTSLGPHDVEVSIAATGLNFRDVMCAMGEVAGDVLGAEGAGTVTRTGTEVSGLAVGDRVALLASYTGCFATHARTVDKAVVSLPDNVAFEEAAGMPVITCTAYYSLVDLARLRKGESVLIHAAAGGVGQAAMMLAQHLGAEIFATVSTEEKKKLLVETYGIVEDHVLYSRDLSFGKDIMRLTKGRGVDVVLNSLAGEALRVSWNCVAPFGRFVEIGKRDIYSNGRLDMFPFSKNITFASCDLETVMKLDQPLMARLLQDTMRLWSHGVFRQTTPLNVFPYSNIESSFRLLQSGKHIGKIVLTSAKDDVVPVVPPPIPDYRFPEEASYVLAGGLGGLGRSIAKWMASRGARHFFFLSRSGSESEAAQALLKELEAEGCQTATFACDVSNADLLQKAIAECASTMPPIRGCIQGAMQLKDSAFETMSHSDFTAAIRPKVHGSFNLHKTLPENLDFFIMLSSICGLIGNRGQSNYAAGNTYQDSLAHFRRQHGQAATTIDLGSMLSVGFIAEHAQTVNPYALAAEAIREDEFHAMLEYHIDPQYKNSPAQVAVGLATKAAFAKKGIPEPSFLRHPLFTLLQCSSSESDSADGESEAFAALRTALRAAKSAEEAVTLVAEMLVQRLSSVMALPAEDIDSSKPIHFYGVDSLVAVEFRNWLAKNLEAEIEVLDIMGDGSIVQLSEKIVTSSKMLAFGGGSVDQR
ncbi:hypothetical protein DL95DRAFT_394758 [Leptodontidium sp. 2 PMI_412]|nr:hypothetical protein DL95DRAFT_394758 [Leptodontidium sp. 2 PMI_412]